MEVFDKNELIGTFEAAYEDDLEANALKGQAKVILQKKKERFDDFATEFKIEKKNLNAAYSRYKELREGSAEVEDDDRYALLAMVDESFQEDEE